MGDKVPREPSSHSWKKSLISAINDADCTARSGFTSLFCSVEIVCWLLQRLLKTCREAVCLCARHAKLANGVVK